jgi:hypothetical protein
MCCRYRGQVVTIRDRSGRVHHGRIVNVTPTHVYIAPQGPRSLGGYGYGFYGGWRFGAPFAIPLAFIAGFALGGLFFW